MEENKKIICYRTHIELNQYTLGECPRLEKRLSTYDQVYYTWIPKGYIYDEERECLLIPSGVPTTWVENLTGRPSEIRYDCDPYADMSIRLTGQPRDELQKESISFLSGHGKYQNYSSYSQMVLNLDTGVGKTFIAIALMTIKRMRTVIIINTSKIKTQWISSLMQYTDISPANIIEVTGSPMCVNIIKKPAKFKYGRVFIVTHDTLRSFGNSYGWENVHELFNAMQVGVKIYDEAHLEFANIVRVDCYTNTKYTYYLTATFGRSDMKENFIYTNCFSSIPKFEQKKRTVYEGKRYITYIAVFYRTTPTVGQIARLKNKYGFNRNAYSRYQLVHDMKFFGKIEEMVALTVIKRKAKTLLLLTTIEGIEDVKEYLEKRYPEITIGTYHSKMKSEEEKAKSMNCDLIISTVKSLGVGADIANLRAIINTESYKSPIITEQILGRLRPLGDGVTCYYIELIDEAFMTLRAQQRAREKLIRSIVGGYLCVRDD